ncbi:hypothetical protein QYI97_10475 [Lacticaseibacillus paracasei]|uniref:hypothetical protein n=1 Tax=Lacticaseibacillus paracasei TaxID=1597 RepID=UPI002604B1EA|nr:hypothetical protein [Lacticaseibacillus paracasei]MDN4554648.1 hypothetical protein [Lacticaseibacillus paracasei]
MNYETKRDVFKMALDDWKQNFISSLPRDGSFEDWSESLSDYTTRYDSALPDDLPVIPKAVGEYIRKAKAPGKWGLLDVFWHLGDNISAVGINGLYDWQRWMADNQVAVARAWLLGVWRVEETGEVVRL